MRSGEGRGGGHEAHWKRELSVRKAKSLFFFVASSTHNTVCFTASHGALGWSVCNTNNYHKDKKLIQISLTTPTEIKSGLTIISVASRSMRGGMVAENMRYWSGLGNCSSICRTYRARNRGMHNPSVNKDKCVCTCISNPR